MLLLLSLASAEPASEVDVPASVPPAVAPESPPPVAAPPPAEAPPAEAVPGNLTVPSAANNPLTMRIAGIQEVPAEFRIGPGPKTERRYQVVDHTGPLSVTEIAARLGDTSVQTKRKKEVTVGAVIGSIGLATAASMLAAHSVESINSDPVAEPVTAITGVLGFVVGVGAFGSVLQADHRPWAYWSPEELQPKVDAANAKLPPIQ